MEFNETEGGKISMKKLLAALLAILMVVSLIGCEKKPQVKEVKIGVAI